MTRARVLNGRSRSERGRRGGGGHGISNLGMTVSWGTLQGRASKISQLAGARERGRETERQTPSVGYVTKRKSMNDSITGRSLIISREKDYVDVESI